MSTSDSEGSFHRNGRAKVLTGPRDPGPGPEGARGPWARVHGPMGPYGPYGPKWAHISYKISISISIIKLLRDHSNR